MTHVVETREKGTMIVLNPKDARPVNSVMIVMHGLGDTAEGWVDAARIWSREFPSTRFILPTAKVQPVTINMGAPMPSWYDIKSLDSSKLETSAEGIEESADRIRRIVDGEITSTGIDKKDIVLAGFSQGGAMSYWVGLQDQGSYAGVVAMSGYLPKASSFRLSKAAAESTPVIHCHGDSDPMVGSEAAVATMDHLEKAGLKDTTFIIYPGMQHSACGEEIRDIAVWLKIKAKLGCRERPIREILESLKMKELLQAARVLRLNVTCPQIHFGGVVEYCYQESPPPKYGDEAEMRNALMRRIESAL